MPRPIHQQAPVWDLLVRLTHWSVAVLFLSVYFLPEEGEDWHEYLGYGLGALLLLRLLWGFVGSANARFSSFFPTPSRIRRYLSRFPASEAEWPGHNPLGGLMVVSLWLGLVLCALSGWLQTTDWFWGEDWPEMLHEYSANAVLALVCLHVPAVFIMQRISGRPLLAQMLGRG
jgi:cytochrome b